MVSPYPGDPDWPIDWQGCTLTGRFIDILGDPVVGSLKIEPSPGVMIDVAYKAIVTAAPRIVTLDAAGAFSIVVPATNDPDINPTNWTYKVTESWPGGRIYHIEAPLGATLDLSELIPATAANGALITRGKSAYEIAVEEGFSGTSAEWIASLRPRQMIPFNHEGTLVVLAGDQELPNDTGRTMTILSVRASVGVAPVGGPVVVDVKLNGVTIFDSPADRPTIAAGARTDTANAIEVPTWAPGDYLTVDITSVGTTTPGSNLTVIITTEG